MKVICILFHIGKNKNRLGEDLKIRLLAGAELAKENEESLVLFVGGYGLETSGAEIMNNFWKKKFREIKSRCFLLGFSNNTFDNLKEIQTFLNKRHISFLEINIISSSYHVKRLQKINRKFDFGFTILSAEDILILRNIRTRELKSYMGSKSYKKKIFLETILRRYLLIDPRERVISFLRRFGYRK